MGLHRAAVDRLLRRGLMPAPRQSATAQALFRLHEQIKLCTRCPLHRFRTQAVPGVGSSFARIVFVGEAPGRQEDRQGEPFVGAAGKVLDELLASVGLSRADVYITNVVKSRPTAGPRPGRNRLPTRDEIAACRPWLDDQLRIIRPAVIVTLGRIALEQFAPGRALAKVHGRFITDTGVTILPLYHPATVLYRRTWMRVLKRDFQRLRRVLTKSRRPQKTAR